MRLDDLSPSRVASVALDARTLTFAERDRALRDEEERDRHYCFERYVDSPTLELRHAAVLLGQSPRNASRLGPVGSMLVAAAQSGELQLVDSLTRTGGVYPQVRGDPLTASVGREALRGWIEANGTDAMRRSLAAKWAGLTD